MSIFSDEMRASLSAKTSKELQGIIHDLAARAYFEFRFEFATPPIVSPGPKDPKELKAMKNANPHLTGVTGKKIPYTQSKEDKMAEISRAAEAGLSLMNQSTLRELKSLLAAAKEKEALLHEREERKVERRP